MEEQKEKKQQLKDMPAKGKKSGNWHFRRAAVKGNSTRRRRFR